jgi:hypothetical protein
MKGLWVGLLLATTALLTALGLVIFRPWQSEPPELSPPGADNIAQSELVILELPARPEGFPASGCPYQAELDILLQSTTYTHAQVREFALAAAAHHPGQLSLAQVCDVYDRVQQRWRYVSDPAQQEVYTPAWQAARQPIGDCDDHAILTASLLMSIGLDAAVSFVYRADTGHAWCEVNLGTTDRNAILRYLSARYRVPFEALNVPLRTDMDGHHWLTLDMNGVFPGQISLQPTQFTRFYPLHKSCEYSLPD